MFSEQPVPPDDEAGGGSGYTGRISSYVWCGLDGMPGSTRGCFSCVGFTYGAGYLRVDMVS